MFLSDGFARNASICVEGIGGADWVDGPSGLGGWRHCPTLYKKAKFGVGGSLHSSFNYSMVFHPSLPEIGV